LGGLRYARVPAAAHAWTENGVPAGIQWLALPSPEGAFRPVQALAAARGYFYLLDGASSRLCLYDSSAALISTFPLPERFTPFSAGRAAMFRGTDGAFIFADYATGEAFLYTDREGGEGARAWVLRAQRKMPVGWRDCAQQPGSEEIACRSGASALRFDGSLNKIPAAGSKNPRGDPKFSASPDFPASRLLWSSREREWVLEGLSLDKDALFDTVALFQFHPISKKLDRYISQ
jgi:hypothetical protein